MCRNPNSMPRRRFLGRLAAAGFAVTPLAALVSACGRPGWPEGMAEIHWDRDTCSRCSMVISDRRFAAEVRGGPGDKVYKFDDIGCVAFWLKDQAWGKDARIWVADAASPNGALAWLDGRQARYLAGRTSPMAYNFAAYAEPQAGHLPFDEMSRQILARARS